MTIKQTLAVILLGLATPMAQAAADFVITNVAVVGKYYSGACNTATVSIKNQGNERKYAGELKVIANKLGGGWQVSKVWLPDIINPGQTRTMSLPNFEFPDASFQLAAVADWKNEMAESNESNNTKSQNYRAPLQNCVAKNSPNSSRLQPAQKQPGPAPRP